MNELIVNLHMHTRYSDGSGSHADLAQAALRSGVDVLLVTDHNILVHGMDAYHREGKKKVLLLVGEEVHDQIRDPQKNHLLVFGVDQELAPLARDPHSLVDAVQRAGGICFIAHPDDPAMPAFGETDISWVDWDVTGFTGLELWNGFSELKSVAKGKWDAVLYAFFPDLIPHGPTTETLRRWNELLQQGRKVVAVGGSDAHARPMSLGPIHRLIFPYDYHFSTINTHILTPSPLSNDLPRDRSMVMDALASGHCFVGNDLPAPTRGFIFTAQGHAVHALMGDQISATEAVTFQARFPTPAQIRLIKDGTVIKSLKGDTLTHITGEPGVYRIEAYRNFLGKMRAWIFSNPIYMR